MTTFYHAFCLLQYNTCNLYVAFGRLIKSRSNDFGFHTTSHVGYFFRTFVDKQHNHVGFRVISGDSISYILHQYGFTRLWLRYNQSTLTFTDRREEVDYTSRKIVGWIALAKLEFFIREKGSKVVERYAVANQCRIQSVYFIYLY